jgi:hypothetical protein
MNRSFAAALTASAFVHGAVFAALLLIDRPRVAEGEPAPLSVTLRPLPSSADQAAGAAAVPVSDAPLDSTEPRRAPPSLVDAPELMRPAPPSVVPEEVVMTRPSVPVDVDTIADIEMPPIGDPVMPLSDVLVTDAPSHRVAVATANRSAPAKRLPIARNELRMLNDKLAQWTEALSTEDVLEPSHSWEHEGRVYTASVRELPAQSEMAVDRKLIEISTTVGGERFLTELSLKQLAFSNFAQFIDRWDPQVQIHDDVVDGRFHSNSEIQVSSSRGVRPTFLGRVTTSSRRVNTSSSRGRVDRDEVFLGGLETGVRRISLPRDFAPAVSDARSGTHMRVIEADARINFYADGSFGWRYLEEGDMSEHRESIDESLYVVAGPKVELHIKGVVNGTVLVYSPNDIIIEGELVYADDPVADPEADDYLGLVSEKSIEVAGPEITGDGDLRIQAAIYARRRFAVRSYRTRQEATLHLFGSLTAGSVSATEPRFATEIRFDPRLEDTRPPSFPVTSRYEIDGWTEQWRVEPLLGER